MIKSQIPNPKHQINPNIKIPNTKFAKFTKLVIGHWIFIGYWILVIGICPLFAQDNNKLVTLTKQIIEAGTNKDLYAPFEELKDLYFRDNKYTEFIEFLKSLSQKKTLEPFVNYYIALARYQQLKYLEETQNWDEYFSQANTYRKEIIKSLQKTINSTTAKDSFYIYAKLLLWQFHKDQQDSFLEPASADLMKSVLDYSQDTQDIQPIKYIADKLMSYGERAKSKELYQIYINKLIGSVKESEELKEAALGFYKEGNLELSELVYDIYIDRIIATYSKEKLLPALKEIAKLFCYTQCRYLSNVASTSPADYSTGCFRADKDAVYAEKVFKKIEDMGGKDAFEEEIMYLRAFNLEKAKYYREAADIYADLIQCYPNTLHFDEASFKLGIIYTYVERDIKTGREYFEKLAQKGTISPQIISSLYQLGLLKQWEDKSAEAKEYYNKLIDKAGGDFKETVTLGQERLKEIEGLKPIEYNLKMFLDLSLKPVNFIYDMTKIELDACPFRPKKAEVTNICSVTYGTESGCMQPELQYLWSGHIGTVRPLPEQSSFNTTYIHSGTKEINLVVLSPAGIIDRDIDMVDVY